MVSLAVVGAGGKRNIARDNGDFAHYGFIFSLPWAKNKVICFTGEIKCTGVKKNIKVFLAYRLSAVLLF